MLKFLTFAFIIFSFSFVNAQTKDKNLPVLFGGNIIYSESDKYECLTDLQNLIGDKIASSTNQIFIEKVPFENRTAQEFYLETNGLATATIKYTCENSLNNAVYTLLNNIGYRWYGPGNNWFYQPKKFAAASIQGKWYKPSFRNRDFDGTGGYRCDNLKNFDVDNNFVKKWEDWKRRNRFNTDFAPRGHTGNHFYLENKKLLDDHPDWFTNATGKEDGRFKIENLDAVNAYKKWVNQINSPSKNGITTIGVEPEDGRGGKDDPLPPPIFKLKNYADKWWWLANEVAKDYPEEDNRTIITAYAYGDGKTNALTPSFPLRKNVYPVIIPYAFQRAYIPEEMVRKWAAKIEGSMGIYDYWNMTQWSNGLPDMNIYNISAKLNFWAKNKIDGIYIETTEGAGPMGHAWWLASQMEWDVNKNFEDLFTEYLNNCFGNGASAIRKMFTRWSLNYQDAGEVSLSLADLKLATDLVEKNSIEWKRINELKAYVHYMKLYYNHDGTQQSKDNIFNYLYSIHHLLMVQTAAFVFEKYIPPFEKGNIVPTGTNNKLSDADIEANFLQDLKENKIIYSIVDFKFDPTKAIPIAAMDTNNWRFGVNANMFFLAPTTQTIKIEAGTETNGDLTIFTDKKVIITENISDKNKDYLKQNGTDIWKMKTYTLDITKGETYFIKFNGGYTKMIFPDDILPLKKLGTQDFDNFAYPLHYFYVPKNATEIVFYDKEPEGMNRRGYFITPGGKQLLREKLPIKNMYRVAVAVEDRGKLWTADFGHTRWSLKNIPNIASLMQFQYDE